jgi:hypothetical protein
MSLVQDLRLWAPTGVPRPRDTDKNVHVSPGLPKQPCSLAQRWLLIRAINADDPRLFGVDEHSQGGASFPESGTSLEDAIKPHASGSVQGSNPRLTPYEYLGKLKVTKNDL